MNRKQLMKLGAAGMILALFAATPLRADDGSWWPRWGMGYGQGMMGGGMMGRGMMGFGGDEVLDRIDGRLAFLKTELKITPQQETAWNGFASTIRDTSEIHNKMMREMMEGMRSGSFFAKPLPERLQTQETFMSARLEQIKSVREATDKLYAVLDDAQKKSADEIVLPMMGMGMGMGLMRGTTSGD